MSVTTQVVVSTLTSIVGSVAGILIVLAMERARRHSLVLSVGQPHEIAAADGLGRPRCRWLRIDVSNAATPRLIRWVYDRFPAYACRAQLTFHRLDGTRLYDAVMEGRWSNTPQPAQRSLINIQATTQTEQVFFDMSAVRRQVDIVPGRLEPLDVAICFAQDGAAYGFNSESYPHLWRHPDWQLPAERILVQITIDSGGREFADVFEIVNDLGYAGWRLDRPASIPSALRRRG
jgi:hypothetical protein